MQSLWWFRVVHFWILKKPSLNFKKSTSEANSWKFMNICCAVHLCPQAPCVPARRLKYFELTLRSSSSQSSYDGPETLASKSKMNVNRILQWDTSSEIWHGLIRLMVENYKPSGSLGASAVGILTEISLCSFAKIFWFIQCNSVFISQLLGRFFLSVRCKKPFTNLKMMRTCDSRLRGIVAIVNSQPGAVLEMGSVWVWLTNTKSHSHHLSPNSEPDGWERGRDETTFYIFKTILFDTS